ncbi:MAG: hypothetical protein ABIO70_12500 [Pseudomonadota bacterium]
MRPLATLVTLLALSACHPKSIKPDDSDPWIPTDDTEGDTDADTDGDTDTDDTGTPWEEREWPATQEMFVSFAYPAAQEQAAVEMTLRVMGGRQQDATTWTITEGDTAWTIHLERSAANMDAGLRTPGAVVVYGGHSNYGIGGVFSDLPDLSQIEDIVHVEDFYNYGGPQAAISYSYLRDTQAYPNLTIRPEDIGEDVENYEVPIIGGPRFPNDSGVGIGDTFTLHGSGSSAYHYTYGGTAYLLVNAGAADLPAADDLQYDILFIKSCNSGRYYTENFQHGGFFYTVDNVYSEHMVVTVDLFVKHILLRTPYWEIAQLMDERESTHVYEFVQIDR